MEELIKQYAGPLIVIAVVIALVIIFGVLLKSDTGGAVMKQFQDLITTFFERANQAIQK